MSVAQNQTKDKWDKISRQSEIKKESQGKDSDKGKNFWQQQGKTERGKKSYRNFLRKFCILKEELKIDMDEYDLTVDKGSSDQIITNLGHISNKNNKYTKCN